MHDRYLTDLEERFIRYVQVDTQADESSPTLPSTAIQLDLQRMLVDELRALGANDARLTDYGAVIATIPTTVDLDIPTIAFLAHVDTSPGFPASGVRPIVHRNYRGGDLVLSDSVRILAEETPYLSEKIGEDVVTASGDTLLGADDKAGVAIVMSMAKHLLEDHSIPHGTIKVCFTPDEEIGRGVHPDLPRDLQADIGYTLDGSDLGEIVYETFSADKGTVQIEGVSIHPGQAKDVMVNALHLAAKIIDTLPQVTRTPETTDGRQGFIHIYHMTGGSASVTLEFILRDFDDKKLAEHGRILASVCETIQLTEPRSKITCTISPQYRNMRNWLQHDMRPVDLARSACEQLGIEVISPPTRGGTDGSRLTELGVPTPNIFTGMQNYHGPLEYVSLQDMEKATEVIVLLAQLWARQD
ncbi:MAG TPA: peptidase T [Thermomicrobiales bacterium]|nr:peptidase T [Thermomicrobiales bacterium]